VVRLLRRVTEDESERTILIALFADIVIAIAKLIGGRSQFDSGPRHHARLQNGASALKQFSNSR
jgi:hypothetical protein